MIITDAKVQSENETKGERKVKKIKKKCQKTVKNENEKKGKRATKVKGKKVKENTRFQKGEVERCQVQRKVKVEY